MSIRTDIAFAHELDEEDELAQFRQRFVIQDPTRIYLDGNSLGRLPKDTINLLGEVISQQWGGDLIQSWNKGWFELPERVGGKMARLLGARPDEVIMADATSVNLFKLALASLRFNAGRRKIITDDLNFPSDVYILQGVCKLAGPAYRLEIVKSIDGLFGPVEDLISAMDEDTCLVSLSHTAFKSSYTYDMGAITKAAHQVGALALWDTSHSVGALPIDLGMTKADLAIGCSYKYVNGGPGAPAYLYVRRDLQDQLENPVSGWMGQKNPFDFLLNYQPVGGLRRFLTGTPPILSLAAIETGIELLLEAGMDRVRMKSVAQSDYLLALAEVLLVPLGFRIKSPHSAECRGSHITLGHKEGWRITRALIEQKNVLPDFRAPDNIRLGIAPLYNTFADIHGAVTRLKEVVLSRLYEHYPQESQLVT